MNPALLLDPRGARRKGDAIPPRTSGSEYVAPTSAFDPRALLNPKSPATKRPASSGGEPDRGRADTALAGQISLVERLHNVQERTASPAKRVKPNEERKKTTNKASFGGGSALELQNQDSQQAAQRGPAIDLTMTDDEDAVEVITDNSMQTICIGKLRHAYIQAHAVPYPDPKKYMASSSQQGRIKVSFRRSGGKNNLSIMATDPTGREFGKIDMKTANGLCPMMDAAKSNGLLWMAWTDPRRKQAGEGGPGSQFSGLISVTLQLYCPRKYANDIGRFLKGRNVDLLRPQFELQRYDYFNPQTGDSLQREIALSTDFRPEVFAQTAPGGSIPGAPGNTFALRSVDEIKADVSDVFDSVVNRAEGVPTREPSSHIKTELYRHQKQALYFMWDKEQDHTGPEFDDRKDSLFRKTYRSNGQKYYLHVITGEETMVKPKPCRGGILADEMGLGKTLSVLSLASDEESIKCAREFAGKKPGPAPPQSKMIQPLYNSRATLIVCPLSTMTNWKEQIKDHFPPGRSTLKWARYHGTERFNMKAEELADHDIVITTYHIIAKDILDRKRPLPYINWFRIVLDEAHTIRNPTNQSRATCMLFGQRRWAVTGTPVQNRLEDLGALLNFIRLSPFDTPTGFNSYVVSPFKNADPNVVTRLQLLVSSVTLRRTKEIIKNELPERSDLIVKLEFSPEERKLHNWFELDTQRKVNAVTSGDKMGGKSYARILTAILNMRLICAHGRDLLSEDALKTTDGMTYENPMEISGEDDVATPALTRQQAYEMLDMLEYTTNAECALCDETSGRKRSLLDYSDDDDEDDEGNESDIIGYMTPCYHVVCPKHLKKLRQQWKTFMLPDGNTVCQICEDRNRPAAFQLKRSDYQDFQDERERIRKDPKLSKRIASYSGPSTKTKALLQDLEQHRNWSLAHPEERPIKSVVFSCWTSHLDIIEIALKHHQHNSCRLDGRMSREARDKSMRLLREDPSVTVMLVSIGAGGLGLNLTTASKVFMMEPQFNPAAEAQAVDRVHRLGQDRDVTIKRFIMDNSFELKMVDLQQKKKKLADLTMARERKSKEEQMKQRLEELRSLFR